MAKELKERECKACGKLFLPKHSRTLYCDDCSPRGWNEARKVEKNIQRGRWEDRIYNPKIYDLVCKECGREFKYTQMRNWCCDSCRIALKNHDLECSWCGGSVEEAYKSRGEEVPLSVTNSRIHYCSDECKQKAYEAVKAAIPAKKCKNCGKEYRGENKSFCSRDCFNAYSKAHPKTGTRKPAIQLPRRIEYCDECGKEMLFPFSTIPTKEVLGIDELLCTECAKVKDAEAKRKKKEKKKGKKEEEYIQKYGMCGICKVPYKDCDWMSSGFRVKPKGARYIDGKIKECPKFISSLA